MKIVSVEAVRLNQPKREITTRPWRPHWTQGTEIATPMARFPELKANRGLWYPKWPDAWAKVTLEDGTIGYGQTAYGPVTAPLIGDYFGPQLVGDDAFAQERLADKLFRLASPFGAAGLASYVISAIDLALWDARGKVLDRPVYELAGGPVSEKMFCYATGNDIDWYQELGFRAFKLACPYGPVDGVDGLRKIEELVASTREQIGNDCELMLDCWMAFDVEYTVRLAEMLRPYRLRWIEEYLLPDDHEAHLEARRRLPWQALATGEHWYTAYPFQWAINNRAVDIVQPDINWVGGFTTCQRIAAAAGAANMSVTIHGGGNTVFGQHFSWSSSAVPWIEFLPRNPPGVPLDEAWGLPGQALPKDGYLVPGDGPGFGLEVPDAWFEPFA